MLPAINKVNFLESGVQAVTAINDIDLSSTGGAISVDDLRSENIQSSNHLMRFQRRKER